MEPMKYLNDTTTTVGKTVHTAKFLLAVNLIIALLAVLIGQKDLFDPKVMSIFTVVNLVLVAAKNFFDKNTPNT